MKSRLSVKEGDVPPIARLTNKKSGEFSSSNKPPETAVIVAEDKRVIMEVALVKDRRFITRVGLVPETDVTANMSVTRAPGGIATVCKL